MKSCVSVEELGSTALKILNAKFPININAAEYLKHLAPNVFNAISIDFYNIVVELRGIAVNHKFYYFLKCNSACQLKILLDLTAIDLPGFSKRFSLFYVLASTYFNTRCITTVSVLEAQAVPSVTAVFGSSGWLEREVWDLFGILFAGNSDLRRILTDYGFRGHPLRKDFPLSGYYEIFYSTTKQRICFTPVSLAQEYRNFLFANPWL